MGLVKLTILHLKMETTALFLLHWNEQTKWKKKLHQKLRSNWKRLAKSKKHQTKLCSDFCFASKLLRKKKIMVNFVVSKCVYLSFVVSSSLYIQTNKQFWNGTGRWYGNAILFTPCYIICKIIQTKLHRTKIAVKSIAHISNHQKCPMSASVWCECRISLESFTFRLEMHSVNWLHCKY